MIFTQNGPNVWRASRTAGRLSGSITEQGSSFSGLPAESMNEATRFAAPLSTGALFFEKNRPVNGGPSGIPRSPGVCVTYIFLKQAHNRCGNKAKAWTHGKANVLLYSSNLSDDRL